MDKKCVNTKINFVNYGPDCKDWTLLHQACRNGTINAVKQLCEYGADVKAICEDKTPLKIAEEQIKYPNATNQDATKIYNFLYWK